MAECEIAEESDIGTMNDPGTMNDEGRTMNLTTMKDELWNDER